VRFHFTRHAKRKFFLVRQAGFSVTRNTVKDAILHPLKIEDRNDGTAIATTLLDKTHILRVVYRIESDIMIIITFYPGRRKSYEI